MNNKIVIEIVDKISQLPQDSEFTLENYFKEYDLNNEDKFELTKEILEQCESKNIIIENTQTDMVLGMPWVYPYKKTN